MTTQSLPERIRIASVACAVFGIGIGVTSLTGWMIGNDLLKGGFIAGITMKANTAVGIAALGLSLLLLVSEARGPVRTLAGRAFAWFAIFLGLATLSQHIFGWDLHIDELLFREAPGALSTQSPNRMGPPASSCLPLLGFALLMLDRPVPGRRAPSQVLAIVALLVAAISILGYGFNAPELYDVARLTSIALQTAVAFAALACGVLCARPDRGWVGRIFAADSGALLIRRLLPSAILLPVLLMAVRLMGQNAGFYDLEFGRVLEVISFIVVFTTLVWWTGAIVGRQERAAAQAKAALTERIKASLVQAQESATLFRTLGETIPDLLWMGDATGAPVYQNPAWTQFTGLSGDAFRAAGWESLHHPDDVMIFRHAWEEAHKQAAPCQIEARLRSKDGTYRWFSCRSVPLKDEAGVVRQWIGTCADVDEHRRAQEALRDADRRKNQFLATLAHELRNPLAPVRNAVQMLRIRKSLEPDVQWAYAVIDRQVDHLTRLIDDLMDVSRISHNKLALRLERVNIEDVLNGAVESSRPMIEAQQHLLTVSVPATAIYIEADPIRLTQVFMNLLTNAAKYTPRAGRITIAAVREDSQVAVRVTDSGIGIDASHLPHLFEMFFQADEVLHRQHSGLGIGLALVRHLVRLHGGTITAVSEGRGHGSEFTVRLPVAVDQSAEASPVEAASGTASLLDGTRVLVVDDNEDAAESLSMFLKLKCADVFTAHDGERALALAESVRPDIVLMDIGLPKMSGYEVAKEIRKQPWASGTLLVALTGWGQPEDRERSMAAGFDHHVVKPVDPDALLKYLGSVRERVK